ncbi:hypothetical protein [Catalinimonas niigatensis]|nr:hypothetical protein [Catalinimonas niigatensis]WPP48930.1 hypothetical protein PZB72_19885 [Catalinimonas niigatensis]
MLGKLDQVADFTKPSTKKTAYLRMFSEIYKYEERNRSGTNNPSIED